MMASPLLSPCTLYRAAIAVFFWLCFLAADAGKSKIYQMGSANFCKSMGNKPRWLAEKSSAIFIGKSKFPWSSSCSIVLGAATKATKNARLRIQFDFIYFDSCGVKLQINQSSTSDFKTSKDNREMFMSGCNHHNPGPLYAQPKHYILISLDKESRRLEGYNFRLNVTMTDKLPMTGTPLYVVIFVSFVCFMVVAAAAIMLYKYIVQREEHREEVIDRAVNLYHTQEVPGGVESTLVYMEPGYGVRAAERRADRPELAFVRGDGRVERFQPLDDWAERNASGAENRSKSAQKGASLSNSRGVSPGEEPTHFYINFPPGGAHHSGRGEAAGGGGATASGGGTGATSTSYMNDAVETSSVGGLELPPSYEEALGMPLPVSAGVGGGSGDATDDGGGGDGGSSGRVVNGAACGASVRSISPLSRGNNNKSPVTTTTTTTTATTAAARGGEDDDEDLINLEAEMADEESEHYMNLGGNLRLLETLPDGVEPDKEEVEA